MGQRVLLGVTGAVVFWSCRPDVEPPRSEGWSVRDSAGVTVVDNRRDHTPRGCVTITPAPRVTIGTRPASERHIPILFRVRGGAVLSDGRIVILNAGTQELLFFSAEGSYQYAVGGKGRGPGEFLDPTWLGRGSADTLFVWDSRLMRLSTFNGGGQLLASQQVRGDGANAEPAVIGGRFRDGSFLMFSVPLVFVGQESGVTRFPETYRRYDPETDHTNHLSNGLSSETVVGGDGVYSLPFGKTELALAHGDFLLVADNGTSAMRYYDMNGQLRRVVEWVSEPIPVTDQEKRAFARYTAITNPEGERERATTLFANERPRFSSIQRDRLGWVWVQSFATRWEPPGGWLVFDENGFLTCAVEPPARLSVLDIGESHILGLQRDELGEETVVLFTLVRHDRLGLGAPDPVSEREGQE